MAAFVLLVLAGFSVGQASTWASIELSGNFFPVYLDPSIKRHKFYWGLNQTEHTNPIKADSRVYNFHDPFQIDNGTIVLPINPTFIGYSGDPQTDNTTVGYNLALTGKTNINPYYGTGLEVHWEPKDSKLLFSYHRVNLGKVQLADICIRDCYWVETKRY